PLFFPFYQTFGYLLSEKIRALEIDRERMEKPLLARFKNIQRPNSFSTKETMASRSAEEDTSARKTSAIPPHPL
ncbi:hypothetical protein LCGC14_2647460, partial [marine sediment metagenome]